jgi:hypothetical protein
MKAALNRLISVTYGKMILPNLPRPCRNMVNGSLGMIREARC